MTHWNNKYLARWWHHPWRSSLWYHVVASILMEHETRASGEKSSAEEKRSVWFSRRYVATECTWDSFGLVDLGRSRGENRRNIKRPSSKIKIHAKSFLLLLLLLNNNSVIIIFIIISHGRRTLSSYLYYLDCIQQMSHKLRWNWRSP